MTDTLQTRYYEPVCFYRVLSTKLLPRVIEGGKVYVHRATTFGKTLSSVQRFLIPHLPYMRADVGIDLQQITSDENYPAEGIITYERVRDGAVFVEPLVLDLWSPRCVSWVHVEDPFGYDRDWFTSASEGTHTSSFVPMAFRLCQPFSWRLILCEANLDLDDSDYGLNGSK